MAYRANEALSVPQSHTDERILREWTGSTACLCCSVVFWLEDQSRIMKTNDRLQKAVRLIRADADIAGGRGRADHMHICVPLTLAQGKVKVFGLLLHK